MRAGGATSPALLSPVRRPAQGDQSARRSRSLPPCREVLRMSYVTQETAILNLSRRRHPDNAPAEEGGDSIGEPEHLLIVGGGEDDRHPLVGELAKVTVDFGASAHVDAASRLLDQED